MLDGRSSVGLLYGTKFGVRVCEGGLHTGEEVAGARKPGFVGREVRWCRRRCRCGLGGRRVYTDIRDGGEGKGAK